MFSQKQSLKKNFLYPKRKVCIFKITSIEIGEQIWLLDAKDAAYLAFVKDTSNGVVSGEITKTFPNCGESPNDIHLILGLIKGRRMDVAIEKAVEFGVKSIQPIIYERCIKKKLNLNRLNKVVIAAAKQSGRSYFPDLSEPLSFLEWTRRRFGRRPWFVIILQIHTFTIWNSEIFVRWLLSIGPEGDFSPKELTVFQELKIPNVKLSPEDCEVNLHAQQHSIKSIKLIKSKMDSCLFCKIIAGDIPSKTIYENDYVMAFDDIEPQAPVHVLIIPKKHISTINDLDDSDKNLCGELFLAAQKNR